MCLAKDDIRRCLHFNNEWQFDYSFEDNSTFKYQCPVPDSFICRLQLFYFLKNAIDIHAFSLFEQDSYTLLP